MVNRHIVVADGIGWTYHILTVSDQSHSTDHSEEFRVADLHSRPAGKYFKDVIVKRLLVQCTFSRYNVRSWEFLLRENTKKLSF